MCRWMGTNFHDWINYNVVAFSIALLDITRMGPKCPRPNPGPCAFSLFCLLFVYTRNFRRDGTNLHILGLWHWVFSVTLGRTPRWVKFFTWSNATCLPEGITNTILTTWLKRDTWAKWNSLLFCWHDMGVIACCDLIRPAETFEKLLK